MAFISYKLKFLAIAVIIFLNIPTYAVKQKKILVIESYHKEFKWDADYRKSLSDYLKSNYNLYFFEMDSKKLLKSEYETAALNAWNYALEIKPDLVILGDDIALKFLGYKFEALKIPTVYLGINGNPRLYFDEEPSYVTGVLGRPLVEKTAEYIKEIFPKTKRVLILFNRDRSSEFLYEEIFKNINNYQISGIHFQIELIENYVSWQLLVANASKSFDVIIVGIYQALKADEGREIDSDEVIKWTSKNASVPIFGFWSFSVGKEKAIGGLVISSSIQGYEAAKIAEKILIYPHVLPKSISPVYLREGSVLFSRYQLKKWRIKLSKSLVHDASFVE